MRVSIASELEKHQSVSPVSFTQSNGSGSALLCQNRCSIAQHPFCTQFHPVGNFLLGKFFSTSICCDNFTRNWRGKRIWQAFIDISVIDLAIEPHVSVYMEQHAGVLSNLTVIWNQRHSSLRRRKSPTFFSEEICDISFFCAAIDNIEKEREKISVSKTHAKNKLDLKNCNSKTDMRIHFRATHRCHSHTADRFDFVSFLFSLSYLISTNFLMCNAINSIHITRMPFSTLIAPFQFRFRCGCSKHQNKNNQNENMPWLCVCVCVLLCHRLLMCRKI